MGMVSRRRCGATLVVWCLFAWSMTYVTYRLQTDKKTDPFSSSNVGLSSTTNTRRNHFSKRPPLIRNTFGYFTNVTAIQEEMSSRTALIKQHCQRLQLSKSNDNSPYKKEYLRRMMVSQQRQIMFCFIPKIANTNFRRIFLYLQGKVKRSEVPKVSGYDIYTKHQQHFKYLNQFNEKQRSQFLSEYKKILFVREPLERLLSGYRNKFFHPNEINRDEYIGKYRDFYARHPELLSEKSKFTLRRNLKEKTVTFEEFLIYWTDAFEHGISINEHFVPTYELAQPCDIEYDFIGKYETLQKDVRVIFHNLGVDVEFPARNDNYSSVNTVDLVEQYYREVPNSLFQKMWKYLRIDSLLFGYKLPEWAQRKLL